MSAFNLRGLLPKPLPVICSIALVAFLLGFVLVLVSGSDGPNGFVFLALSAIVLIFAAGAVTAAIREIPRDDLDIEIVLFLVPSAVLGAVLFFLILGSYILGLSAPYAVSLVDWNQDDGEMHWAGWTIILLIGAGLLAVCMGGPVGIVAWASRLVGQRRT